MEQGFSINFYRCSLCGQPLVSEVPVERSAFDRECGALQQSGDIAVVDTVREYIEHHLTLDDFASWERGECPAWLREIADATGAVVSLFCDAVGGPTRPADIWVDIDLPRYA